jgi:molecular chaperone DnaK
MVVGVDLGTTNSVVAWVDAHGVPVVAPSAEGRAITPSVVCFRDGGVVVGEAAKELQGLGTWPVAAFFKRQMGDPLFMFHAAGRDYSATDLSALVIGKLKADAEAHLQAPVTHAVITVPAYFRERERKATIAAGVAAGLEVLQVINEPTAAAVAYGLSRDRVGQRILVYDLGGGTFDVTLLDLTAEGVVVRTSEGNHQLGGKDWDDRIIEFLASRFRDEHGVDPLADSESLADLLVRAEEAKKRLSAFDSTDVSITHDGCRGRYTLDRVTFEALTSDLLERTVTLTRRVLEDQGLGVSGVDGVLLVGGATRMPMVQRFVSDTFGRAPLGGVNVDEAVALGAAIVANEHMAERGSAGPVFALRGPTKTTDVTNHSLGMIAINADRSAYVNSIILPKDRQIPCEDTRPYQHRTRSSGENVLEVFMTQGETDSPAEVTFIGRYVVHDVPHQPSGITAIDIAYGYDRSGIVNVRARPAGAAHGLRVTVEELPHDVPGRFLVPPQREVITTAERIVAYLVLDVSGSMIGRPLDEAKRAARGFLENIELEHCSLGIIAFNDQVMTLAKAGRHARAIEWAISNLVAGGGTNANPFTDALALLNRERGRRFVIVLTDGQWGNQAKAIESARACHRAKIDVIAIGFGSADEDFLRAIASSDEASFFTKMGDLEETFSTIAQVLTETGGGGGGTPGSERQAGRGFLTQVRKALKR